MDLLYSVVLSSAAGLVLNLTHLRRLESLSILRIVVFASVQPELLPSSPANVLLGNCDQVAKTMAKIFLYVVLPLTLRPRLKSTVSGRQAISAGQFLISFPRRTLIP